MKIYFTKLHYEKTPNSMIEAAVYWLTCKFKNSVGIKYYFKVSMQMYDNRKWYKCLKSKYYMEKMQWGTQCNWNFIELRKKLTQKHT